MVLLVPLFQALRGPAGLVGSAAILGFVSLLIAFWAVSTLPESFGKDLDYVER
nr:hypothetical protein [Hymenobacter sp. 5516J-16]